jgi:hypothetical protein
VTHIDHVVWAVPSIAPAAERLLAHHGLLVLGGGVHPAWGTRNAIVPLAGAYIELVEVADPEAPDVGFTRRIREVAALGGGPALWSEGVDDIDREAARRGYEVVAGRRENPDGSMLSWRVAGMPQACAHPALPFLIQWDDPAAMPGAIAVDHPCGAIKGLQVDVDDDGPRCLTIHCTPGTITLP